MMNARSKQVKVSRACVKQWSGGGQAAPSSSMADPASLSAAASVSGPLPAPHHQSRKRLHRQRAQSAASNEALNKRRRRSQTDASPAATANAGQSESRGSGKGRPPTSVANHQHTASSAATASSHLRPNATDNNELPNNTYNHNKQKKQQQHKSPRRETVPNIPVFRKHTRSSTEELCTPKQENGLGARVKERFTSTPKNCVTKKGFNEAGTSNWRSDRTLNNSAPPKVTRGRRNDSVDNQTGGLLDRTFPTSAAASHRYQLRSRGTAVDYSADSGAAVAVAASPQRRPERKAKNLGANLAKHAAAASAGGGAVESGSEPGPSTRLARGSAVVLRRSTRNSKGLTTGSCASSGGGGGGGGGSSGRVRGAAAHHAKAGAMSTSQQHETGTATATTLPVTTNNAQDAVEPPSPQEGTQASASSGGPSGPGVDSESDDSEVGRLQALLEARGLPPHLFGALGPRMQQMLHRSMGTGSSSKAQQLLQGLQASGDEGQQLQAVIEMCQMLVMGNEDTLSGFPVKQVVPALINLLNMEHNFDMMNHACRALTYMMEALPRSSAVVVDAVPVFLDKLQVIQCMDVAEQSLTALDMLSRRHSKAILQARGVSACLMYLDFFSINAQRAALSVTANCCQGLSTEEFALVAGSLPLLAGRLAQQDRRSVESVCLAFSRLTESMQADAARMQEIASTELLNNMQQLLVVSPPVISTGTFITVLRMLSTMCSNCPELALTLLRQNIADTLVYLLTGGAGGTVDIELMPRSPQELYEITCLIGELMPRLPTDGIFAVDALLERPSQTIQESVQWQWRDDRGSWHAYSTVDSRIIETAHVSGEDEVNLTTLGRTYTVDFHTMQQINEDTGTSRPVQRRYAPANATVAVAQLLDLDTNGQATTNGQAAVPPGCDARVHCLKEERGLAATFIRSLFSVLYEVYSSSAGPAVRCKCLRALLRMVYYANADLLKEVLKNQVVSSHIAGMMASNDLRIVVGALQMAEILMSKLPDEFGVHFRREGVMHQITQLADPQVPLGVSPPKNTSANVTLSPDTQPQPSTSSFLASSTPLSLPGVGSSNGGRNLAVPSVVITSPSPEVIEYHNVRSPSPSQVRLSDVLKRKRPPKRSNNSSRSKSRQEELNLSSSLMQDLFSKATSLGSSAGRSTPTGGTSGRSRFTGASAKTTSFLASLNPARWGRSINNSVDRSGYGKDGGTPGCLSKSLSQHNLTAGHREKARTWVRDQASKFLETYSGDAVAGPPHPALNVLARLKNVIEKLQTLHSLPALQDLRNILIESDISPFEVNHSGLIKALLSYLADIDGVIDRDDRLRTFLHVFANLSVSQHPVEDLDLNTSWMSALVSKLNGCVSQLEQFPVKVHDLPAGSGRGNTSALKFFNTHQLKCNLQRHPDCNNLKQWKGGTVKIDPLALVQAIERYLVVRGYGRVRDKDSGDSDDDNSDEDVDDTLAAVVISQGGSKHKLQFLIGNQVLPYHMTVYQAVRQFSSTGNDQSETDTDTETPLGNAGVWVQTHTIYYRPLIEDSASKSTPGTSSGGSGRKGKGTSSKTNHRRKGDDLWNEGQAPQTQSPLNPFLSTRLPDNVTVQDASLDVLCLLRILNAMNRHWASLYTGAPYRLILPQTEFINSKLAAKASRQLQDPLVIMTGNLPSWLSQIAGVCPFLFPFETRQLLFYATSFDRDRALQRLLDATPELSTADSQERVTPRLDRRKRTISRDDILRQAEQVIQDLAGSKALLEVQYENEVGTGLGPTLEFYALVSRELQRSDLELWKATSPSEESPYVHSAVGLFPSPLGRPTKVSHVSKVKAKFKFLGKFMAKAVMDSRMLDLPFSVAFHRWLLGQEACLTLSDLEHVAPDVHRTLVRLQPLVRQRDLITADTNLTTNERTEQCERLGIDGCPVSELGLDFILPGHSSVELRRGGKDTAVTIHNLDEYLRLVTHWFLVEGVSRQMDALREGFESVFPLRQLQMFYPEELEAVFCGNGNTDGGWDVRTLMECCRPDHGYTADSRAIRFLFEVLSGYNTEEQRLFVQFVTGSPRLPVGGFRALTPPLTVVRKTLEPNMNPDDYLPSVMTCVNYLKLPEYTCVDVMKDKLRVAATEGQHSFHLS